MVRARVALARVWMAVALQRSRLRQVSVLGAQQRWMFPLRVLALLGRVPAASLRAPTSRGRALPAVLLRLSWLRLIPLRVLHCLRMMQRGRGLL